MAAIETLEDRRLMSTYTVTSAADSGSGSLRQAILDANNHAGADTIKFAIGSGAKTINLASKLPGLSDGTNLDATTQPGYAGKPIIELNGAGAGAKSDGIKIFGSGVTVKGLIINRFNGNGMLVVGKGHNTIANCFIGTNSAGTGAAGNGEHGIIIQAANNTVRDCVISANPVCGVFLYTTVAHHNVIAGNKIGTDVTGTAKLGNGRNGVQANGAPLNVIGGIGASQRNIISGNGHDGILIATEGAKSNAVQGNYIGVDATGNKRLGNGHYGVEVSRQDNVIGGSAAGAGNVVSANGKGGVVLYLTTASGNRVQGNYIGTDKTGTKDLGNTGRGLEFTNGAHDNLAGGDRSSQRNVISGNDFGGVGIYSGSKFNWILKNYVGVDATGYNALGNTGIGIYMTDSAGTNIIGGRRAGNIVAANTGRGIAFDSGTGASLIHGNYVGTDVTGTKDLGNGAEGIYAGNSGNQIGGRKGGTGNLVVGNASDGVRVNNSKGNLVRLNIIGVGANGAAIANGGAGVLLSNATDTPVRGNVIARNSGDGVKVAGGARNAIVSNSMWGNGAKPINITGAKQANPTISSIKLTGGQHVITGSVTSKAKTSLYLELFATSSDGEGKTLIGTGILKTNASGVASFVLKVEPLAAGSFITATATAADGSTSEFTPAKAA